MSKHLKTILFYWLPVILWMGVIFYLSNQPDLKTNLGIWDTILRKIAHAFEFGILTLLVWRTLAQYQLKLFYLIGFSSLISLLYAISDEWHQSFINSRNGNVLDVLIDCVGIVVIIIIVGSYYRSKEVRKIKKKFG
ncbi:VanZ family protein [Patescibacteria group bacterium]